MARVEKTVFISYRRKDFYLALNIYEYLDQHGYDVFFDNKSIHSGDFERIIISNIKARAHFVVILTPTALDRCNKPNDWLRREIEVAIDEKRNIIPLLVGKFDFEASSVKKRLKGKLGNLQKYNGLEVHASYFYDAMDKLHKQYLNTPLDSVLHPVSNDVQEVVIRQQTALEENRQKKEARKNALQIRKEKFIFFVKAIPKNSFFEKTRKTFPEWYQTNKRLLSIITLLILAFSTGRLFYNGISTQIPSERIYFTSDRSGKNEIHYLDDNGKNIKMTSSSGAFTSWGASSTVNERVYFTSDRSGKNEIYYLDNDSQIVKMTSSPENSTSWEASPASNGRIYFTSDRSGKNEIYYLDDKGNFIQMTFSPDNSTSWGASPASNGRMYFASNRSGKSEIYYLDNDGQIIKMTSSPNNSASWEASPAANGRVYFTSNRSGKNEIYYLDDKGGVIKMTSSPDSSTSQGASPASNGRVYFTSNRSGKNEIYYLDNNGHLVKMTSSPNNSTSGGVR